MNETLKAAIGQYMKRVNFAVQPEIEKSVRNAVANGKLEGNESFTAAVALSSEKSD